MRALNGAVCSVRRRSRARTCRLRARRAKADGPGATPTARSHVLHALAASAAACIRQWALGSLPYAGGGGRCQQPGCGLSHTHPYMCTTHVCTHAHARTHTARTHAHARTHTPRTHARATAAGHAAGAREARANGARREEARDGQHAPHLGAVQGERGGIVHGSGRRPHGAWLCATQGACNTRGAHGRLCTGGVPKGCGGTACKRPSTTLPPSPPPRSWTW